jgi:hypothetical protein
MDARFFFPGEKAAVTPRWPPTPLWGQGRVSVELYFYVPITSAWHVSGQLYPLHKKKVDFANLMLNVTDDDDNFFTASNEAACSRKQDRIWEQEQPLKFTSLCETARKLRTAVVQCMIVLYDLSFFLLKTLPRQTLTGMCYTCISVHRLMELNKMGTMQFCLISLHAPGTTCHERQMSWSWT